MAAPDTLKFGLPFKRIVQITEEPFGPNGGHLLVLLLECGHIVKHLRNSCWKVGRRTRCEECR